MLPLSAEGRLPLLDVYPCTSLSVCIYIFNAFISGHAGIPEIAGRYLAVFQVLISSRTRYHPPFGGWGCRLEASTPAPTPSILPSPTSIGVARDAPIRLPSLTHPLIPLTTRLPSHRRRIFRYLRRLRSNLRVTLQ